jgi:hypothetical protein
MTLGVKPMLITTNKQSYGGVEEEEALTNRRWRS